MQSTALVHEAYLRLVDVEKAQNWNSRGHFFAAAAEAMRRILIDNARRKLSEKHGGGLQRVELDHFETASRAQPEELLVIDDMLEKLSKHDPVAGQLVKLRYFAEMSVEEAAEALGLSRTNAYRLWSFIRAWLRCEVSR